MSAGLALVLAAQVLGQTTRCLPPLDSPLHCPEKYMPVPTPPSKAGYASIESMLVMAEIAEGVQENEREKLSALRAKAKLDASLIPQLVAQADIVKDAVTRTRFFYNEAVRRTRAVYHLDPPKKDLSADAGIEHYSFAVPWNPRFSEREYFDGSRWRRRTADERKKWNRTLTVGGQQLAVGLPLAATRPNGEIELFKDAFASPDTLASAMIHETSHWVDTSAVGGRRRNIEPAPHFRTEERAYEHEAALARTLGKSDSFPKAIATQYREQAKTTDEQGLGWDTILLKHSDWLDYDLPVRQLALGPAEGSSPTGKPEETRIAGELSFLRSWSEAAAPVLREGQRQREADRIETEKSLRHGRWNALRMWSSTACRYMRGHMFPTEDPEQQESRREMTRLQRKFLLEHFVVLPAAEIRENLNALGRELDACEREMIEMFLSAPGPVEVGSLIEKIDYQRSGGDFGAALRGAARAISDGTVAVVRGIAAPFIAVADALSETSSPGGGTAPAPSRPPSGSPPPQERERQDIQPRGPAWGQLNRVRVGGW